MKDAMLKYKAIGALGITANAKLIYSLLIDNIDDTGELNISIRVIAKTLGISKRAVANNLHHLVKSGLILAIPQYNPDGGRTANKYILK